MEKISIENLHNDAVKLIQNRCAKMFLPFIVCALPIIFIEVLTFGLAVIFGGFIWVLFDIATMKIAEIKLSEDDSLFQSKDKNTVKFSYFKNFFSNNTDFNKVFVLSTLKRLIIIGGLVLFIIPGIYLWLSFALSSFIAVDNKSLTVHETLNKSCDLIVGHRLQLLRTYSYCCLVMIVTIGTFGLLSPWTLPYISAMKYNFYRALIDDTLPVLNLKKALKIDTKPNNLENEKD